MNNFMPANLKILDNLDKFLEGKKTDSKEMKTLNCSITTKEIKLVKTPDPDDFIGKVLPNIKEKIRRRISQTLPKE